MNVITNLRPDSGEVLEHYRPAIDPNSWELVVEGNWSQSMYHGGFFSYSIARTAEGYWALNQCERNGCLDGVTEEDVENGDLNDDQREAIWHSSLEEAQNERFDLICAVWLDPPAELSAEDAGRRLYKEYVRRGGMRVEE